MSAIKGDGTCLRCYDVFGTQEHCGTCGVHRDRTVRYVRRRSKATGKRGKNSGTVGSNKN